MQKKITPLIKGLITGASMVLALLAIYYFNQTTNQNLQYVIYLIYGGGIAWTLISYSRSGSFTGKFSDLFGQGFRCFIIVILIIVLFIVVVNLLNPEFATESAKLYKEDLEKNPNLLPAERESQVANFKKQYILQLVYPAIFGYLIIGSVLTAAGSGIILLRRK
jgi:hypothetical protein